MLNLESLLSESFLVARQENATAAIEDARERIATEGHLGAFAIEVVAPPEPDASWLSERVLRPLVYFCESSGASLPACAGVFVCIFHQGHLHCVLGAEVVAWAEQSLGIDPTELVRRYGTGEREAPATPT